MLIYGKDYLTRENEPFAIDSKSRAVPIIDFIHFVTHLGNMFNVSAKLSIATGTDAFLLGKVGNEPIHWNHYSVGANDGPLDIYLYETPTTTADGSALSVVNRNRESSNTTSFTAFAGPTVSANGTELFISGVLSSAVGANLSTRDSSDDTIWILNPNTNYLFRIHNNGAGTADVWTHFAFHEMITDPSDVIT